MLKVAKMNQIRGCEDIGGVGGVKVTRVTMILQWVRKIPCTLVTFTPAPPLPHRKCGAFAGCDSLVGRATANIEIQQTNTQLCYLDLE
jgi:hypothetical protein